jgi:large subunit ribosomal protein L45
MKFLHKNNAKLMWKLVSHVTEPKIVHIRAATAQFEQDGPQEKVAQVTVKFHTKQTVALYDTNGRVISGDPEVEQEVEEYVVFESMVSKSKEWVIAGKVERN